MKTHYFLSVHILVGGTMILDPHGLAGPAAEDLVAVQLEASVAAGTITRIELEAGIKGGTPGSNWGHRNQQLLRWRSNWSI